MKQKEIIIISIVVIIAILLCLATFLLVNSHEESLSTLRISSSCTISVPATNNTVESLGDGVSKYIFKDSDVNITHQKTENNSEIKNIYSDMIKNSKEVEDGIYYDSSAGIYSTFIEDNESGDAILITAKDINLLKKIAKSVKFTKPVIPETNTTDEGNYSEEGYDYSNEGENYPSYEPTPPSNNGNSSEPAPSDGDKNQN